MSSSGYLIFNRPGSPNDIRPKNFAEGKKVSEIAAELNLENEILAIVNDKFVLPLNPDTVLLEKYPDVVMMKRPEKFQRTTPYCTIISAEKKNCITLFVDVVPQEGVEFPYFGAEIDLTDIQTKTCNELLEKIDSFLDVPHKVESLNTSDDVEISDEIPAEDCIEMAKENRLKIKVTFGEKEIDMFGYRKKLLAELANTELTYINTLNRLTEFWQPNVLQAGIISEEEAGEMFKHFPIISACHTRFYNNLIAAGTEFPAQVAVVLLNFSEFFKPSSYYIGIYKIYTSLIAEKLKNEEIQKRMNAIELKNTGYEAETLSSCLITPVQRVPRYILLIRELLKKTPKCHPDRELLVTAASYIDTVTKEIEIKAAHAESNFLMLDLERRLNNNKIKIFSEAREIEDTLDISYSKPSKMKGKLYILTDMVVFTAVNKSSEKCMYYSQVDDSFYYPLDKNRILLYSEFELGKKIVVEFSDISHYTMFLKKITVRPPDVPNQLTLMPKAFRDKVPAMKKTAACYLNDTLYVFGGIVDGSASNVLYVFKPTLGTITKVNTPLVPRMDAKMCVYNDEIYIFGGRNDYDYPTELWKFSTLMGSWTQLAKIEKGRAGFTMDIANEKIFVFGGYRKKKILNSTAIYDLKRNIWHEAVFEGAPEPRVGHCSCIIDSTLIIMGGKNKDKYYNDVAFFDTKKIYWRSTNISYANFPHIAYAHTFVFGANILVFGGWNKFQPQKPCVVDTYKKEATEFNIVGNYPKATVHFTPVIIENDELWMIGGTEVTDTSSYAIIYTGKITNYLKDMPTKIPDYLKKGALKRSLLRKVSLTNGASTEMFGELMTNVKRRRMATSTISLEQVQNAVKNILNRQTQVIEKPVKIDKHEEDDEEENHVVEKNA